MDEPIKICAQYCGQLFFHRRLFSPGLATSAHLDQGNTYPILPPYLNVTAVFRPFCQSTAKLNVIMVTGISHARFYTSK